ncbi:hypothetical protein M378DRAFT_172846 [Amanita muscaria Koide BX008]|uniref:Uncharacterized protein n=1 Tax=Amanita muscaria (strain Koide BX008) TaxID=946122 RepID=A0A0C2S0U8_AMAMK|nr:hypothetical protein M378DRAFT_172846 [Amanita muscaria Koide BX008]
MPVLMSPRARISNAVREEGVFLELTDVLSLIRGSQNELAVGLKGGGTAGRRRKPQYAFGSF